MIKKLLPCAKGFGVPTFFTSFFVLCEALLEVYIPFLMMKIVDIGAANGDLAYVLKTGALMLGIAFASLLCGILSARCAAVSATGFARNVRSKLFRCIQNFSFANIDRFSTASLITRLTIDVTNTQLAYMMTFRLLVRAPVILISATVMAWRINASLSAIFLIAIPVLAVTLALVMKAAYPRFGKMLEKYDRMNGEVQEKLTAIRVIKAFVREDYECENFEEAANALRVYQRNAEKTVIINLPVMMASIYICILAVIWFGGNQIIGGTMTAGALFSLIGYVTQVLIALMLISMAFITIVISRASMKRICEIYDEVPDIADTENEDPPAVEDGSVVFDHVSFRYGSSAEDDKLILDDVNFRIPAGATVGVLGGTGSAKTTLVQLIPRLYDVCGGSVLVGGHDVREYRIADLRHQVAMVLQSNLLFSGSIAENLRWGDSEATDEELVEAAKTAQAHDFIMSFPDGYQTHIEQGGVNVSGGQKQRLCIARALLAHPKVVILDDSTSAVDTATDAAIRQGFRERLADVTTIIIAQRISSVMDADLILVLDEGSLVAQGDHDTLLRTCPIYSEVYASQQKGVE